ncbi:MAG: hypothetical protein ACOCUD_01675 [Bacillota bacterium]
MNKQGELRAKTLIIILIMFLGICGLGFAIVTDMASDSSGYGVDNMTNSEFEEDYGDLGKVSDDIYEMRNASSSKEGTSTLGTTEVFLKGTFTIISLIWGSVEIIDDTITNLFVYMKVPTAIANVLGNIIILGLTAALTFIIINSISRTQKL